MLNIHDFALVFVGTLKFHISLAPPKFSLGKLGLIQPFFGISIARKRFNNIRYNVSFTNFMGRASECPFIKPITSS